MTMSTSYGAQPSSSISKSEFLSSLPRWRRWLSRLNWHPVVEYEIREIEHEKRMKQLKSEIEQLDALNSKIDALLFSSSTSSIPPQNTPNSSEG
jgi:hypothetical protein